MKALKYAVQLICLSIATNTHAADVLSYTLLPGSTITPYFGGTPIGPTEPLTGNFDWIEFDTASTLIGFDATHLDFQSESFRIRLNATVNGLGTAVFFPDSCLTYFDEIVDLEGLGTSVGELSSFDNNGCYSGPPDHPRSLTYPNLGINPVGGGLLVEVRLVKLRGKDRDRAPDDQHRRRGRQPKRCPVAHADAQRLYRRTVDVKGAQVLRRF